MAAPISAAGRQARVWPWFAVLGTVLVLGSACSGEDERPRPPPSGGKGGTAGSTGGAAGAAPGDGMAASGGSAASAPDGAAGVDGSGVCGNGVADPDEQCDGNDLKGNDCTGYGFERGTLRCGSACLADTTGCSGAENCFDGRDNDGDGAVDCSDSGCMSACSSSCGATAPTLADPTIGFQGLTGGHASQLTSSCAAAGSGPEVAFQFTAQSSGLLDVELTAPTADLNLSLRRTCADATSELGCSEKTAGSVASERLRVPVTQGMTVFIVVDGTGAGQVGLFTLNALSRPIRCGDSIRDDSEGCDDGNMSSGDGCSSGCGVEPDEIEPNNDSASATPYSGAPFFAEISPAGDQDVFSVAVQNAGSTLRAETLDLGDSACPRFMQDSFIEILDGNGTTTLASNDDFFGFCARASASGLAAGTYFVRVRGSGGSVTFPYNLRVTVTP